MASPEPTRAARAVNPPITLASVADIARATLRVMPNRSLGAIELHVDHKPLLLLSDAATAALVAALLEALADIGIGCEP